MTALYTTIHISMRTALLLQVQRCFGAPKQVSAESGYFIKVLHGVVNIPMSHKYVSLNLESDSVSSRTGLKCM